MIGHLLNRTAALWRKSTTSDGSGGQTVEWAQAGTVPVRLSSPRATERQAAAQEGAEITHVAYFGADSDVRRGDRLIDGDLTVELLAVTVPSDPRFQRADCRQEHWDEPTG